MRRYLLPLLLTLMLAACASPGPTTVNPADGAQLLEEGSAALEAEDYARAEELLRQAQAINPTDVETLAALGRTLLSQGELEEAATVFEDALEQEGAADNVNILFDYGVVRYEQGQVAQAIQLFEQARGLSPNDAELLYNLGSAYAQEQQFDTAIELYTQATTISPTLPLPYFGLGTLYQATDQTDAAIAALTQFLTLTDDPDLRARAQSMLADLQGQ